MDKEKDIQYIIVSMMEDLVCTVSVRQPQVYACVHWDGSASCYESDGQLAAVGYSVFLHQQRAMAEDDEGIGPAAVIGNE